MSEPIAHTASDGGDPQTLADHLDGVAGLAASFAVPWGKPGWAAAAGAWHDLGKYAADVQHYLAHAGEASRGPDHSTAGAIHATDALRASGRLLAYVIAGHHAGLPDWDGVEGGNSTLKQRLAEKRGRLDAVLASPIPVARLSRPSLEPLDRNSDLSLFVRMLFSTLIDADRLDTEAFASPEQSRQRRLPSPIGTLAARLDEHLANLMARAPPTEVNGRRSALLQECRSAAAKSPGLFSLTAPTGLGKTLSGLAFALHHAKTHGLARVIYVAPYTSIIEQTADVFRDALGDDAVLEHHSNLEPDETLAGRAQRLATENWDAAVVVTTAVQFFESLFSARPRRCRKLHRIANAVVFIDEVQLLPPDFLTPVLRTLDELTVRYRTSIVLSTATQPALDPRPGFPGLSGPSGRREIVSDPPALHVAARRVRVILPDDLHATTAWQTLADRLLEHSSVLCILDRRADARALHALLPIGAVHLSALMCGAHRARALVDVRARLKRGEAVRLVSTQLVEAGVDVDFPVVFRALAGLDSLAQAAGRCNREGKLIEGVLHVFVPPLPPPLGHLRQAADLARLLLQRRPADPFAPEMFNEFFRQFFWIKGDQLDKHRICERLPRLPSDGGFAFRTASDLFRLIPDDEVPVLVPYGETGTTLIARFEALRGRPDAPRGDLYRRAQRFRVGVPRWLVHDLERDQVIRLIDEGLWAAASHAYHSDYGLDLAGRVLPESMIV